MYSSWSVFGCFNNPCLCSTASRPFVDGLLACSAVEGGYFWELGSIYTRVIGRRDDACVVRVGIEVESGVKVYDCSLPLPVQPWPGLASMASTPGEPPDFLDGIEARCPLRGQCSLVPDGPNPCFEDTALAAPVCPGPSGATCD